MSEDLTITGSPDRVPLSTTTTYWEMSREINKLQSRFPNLDRETIKKAIDAAFDKVGTRRDRQAIENYVMLSLRQGLEPPPSSPAA
jgi:hypothetical protein